MTGQYEEYDISQPGSFFGLVVREPTLWKLMDAKARLAVARDWEEVGAPYPDKEVFQRLSPTERVKLQGLLTSLANHARANRASDLAALKAQLPQKQPGEGGRVTRSRHVVRDDGGKIVRLEHRVHD